MDADIIIAILQYHFSYFSLDILLFNRTLQDIIGKIHFSIRLIIFINLAILL